MYYALQSLSLQTWLLALEGCRQPCVDYVMCLLKVLILGTKPQVSEVATKGTLPLRHLRTPYRILCPCEKNCEGPEWLKFGRLTRYMTYVFHTFNIKQEGLKDDLLPVLVFSLYLVYRLTAFWIWSNYPLVYSDPVWLVEGNYLEMYWNCFHSPYLWMILTIH